MCSIVEDDFGDDGGVHAMLEDKLIESSVLPEVLCKKCNQDNVVVQLSFKDAQCKNCFLLYVRHKMRATLGASKIVPKNSKILLEFDGTRNNIVLLDMINYSLSQSTFKRLHFDVQLIYIDDSFIMHTDRMANYNRIKDILQQFEFTDVLYTSLGDEDRLEAFNKVEISKEPNEHEIKFTKSLNDIKSVSSKQDFVTIAKKRLLYKQCNKLGCTFIFTSEISSDLAKTLLTNISLGRGSSVALDIGFVDARDAEIKQIRPIRDLNQNEINNYIKLNELKYRDDPGYGKNLGEFSSIQNLTDSFVENLQQNFASTVSTIYRTGDKMASHINTEMTCKFCRATIDCNNSNTLFAIEFSRAVSTNPNLIKDGKISDDDMNRSIENSEDVNDISELKSMLCHGCRNIFADFDGAGDDFLM